MCQASLVAPFTVATNTFPFGNVKRPWPSSLPASPSLPSSRSSFARSAHRKDSKRARKPPEEEGGGEGGREDGVEGEEEGDVRTGLLMMCWDLRCPPREREREGGGEEEGERRDFLLLLLLGLLSSSLLVVAVAAVEGAMGEWEGGRSEKQGRRELEAGERGRDVVPGRKAKGRCWGAVEECSHPLIPLMTWPRRPPPVEEEEGGKEGEAWEEMQRTSVRLFGGEGELVS